MANYEFDYTVPGFDITGKIKVGIECVDGKWVADINSEDLREKINNYLKAVGYKKVKLHEGKLTYKVLLGGVDLGYTMGAPVLEEGTGDFPVHSYRTTFMTKVDKSLTGDLVLESMIDGTRFTLLTDARVGFSWPDSSMDDVRRTEKGEDFENTQISGRKGEDWDVFMAGYAEAIVEYKKYQLQKALRYVNPVADAMDYWASEVDTMLSVLADNGIEGSMAGTNLVQIMLKAKKAGGDVASVIEGLEARDASVIDYQKTFGLIPLKAVLVLRDNLSSIQ